VLTGHHNMSVYEKTTATILHVEDTLICLSIYLILPAALGPGVYSASNRNEYQKQEKWFWGVERGRRLRSVGRSVSQSQSYFTTDGQSDPHLIYIYIYIYISIDCAEIDLFRSFKAALYYNKALKHILRSIYTWAIWGSHGWLWRVKSPWL
jgi:hypothetical protein